MYLRWDAVQRMAEERIDAASSAARALAVCQHLAKTKRIPADNDVRRLAEWALTGEP